MPPSAPTPSVVLAHNRYRVPGGEERALGAYRALLEAKGHEVEVLERSSADLAGLGGHARAGVAMLRGGLNERAVEAVVSRLGAGVFHVHNMHPLLGPRALDAARRAGARVVLHLHNYRLFCAIGVAYRDGAPCYRCRGRSTGSGLRLRCRGNLSESAVYAVGLAVHQPRVFEDVDRFIVPSRATADQLIQRGLPEDRVEIIPNFLPDEAFVERSQADRGSYALFAGRITEEKGADIAIEAARLAGIPLVIAGSGPDEERLRRMTAGPSNGAPVRFLGRLDPAEMDAVRRDAAFCVAPSRWLEVSPFSVIEAMAGGLPVLATDIGGLPEMVGAGPALPPAGAQAWADAMRELWEDPELRRKRGDAALARARERFGTDRAYERLLAAYARAGADISVSAAQHPLLALED